MRFCNDEGEVPYCPGDLEQELNGLLEKASTLLDGNDDRLLIVIDGADMVTVCTLFGCSYLGYKFWLILINAQDQGGPLDQQVHVLDCKTSP